MAAEPSSVKLTAMARSADDTSTPLRIVEATLRCIERQGISAVTSRSIAQEAGVNLAAINYHFGGKAKAIDRALKTAIDSAFVHPAGDLKRLKEAHGDTREALHALVDEMVSGALRHPRTGLAIVYETLVRQKYETVFVKRLNSLMEQLYPLLETELRGETESDRRASLSQLWSSVMFVGLLPHAFDHTLGGPLTSDARRKAYVRMLVESHLSSSVRRRRSR